MTEQRMTPIVFLAFANEQDDRTRYLRTLAEEGRRLRHALEQAEAQGLCQLEVRTNATLSDIRDVFRKYDSRIAVLHFGGHADSYQLLFEATGGKRAAIDATGFAEFLAQQAGLQLVFLNACSTAAQVTALQAAGVPVVIATGQDIPDAMATDFADEFYRSLATGTNSISKAFAEATALIKAQGGAGRHLRLVTPEQAPDDHPLWQLYTPPGAAENAKWSLQIAANDPLFGLPPLPKLDLPETPYRHLEWFRREDAELFFGRSREIAELYQQATTPDGAPLILFYGQSGVGKSSVLAAGLLPRLAQKQGVVYQRRDQAKGLAATLATALSAGDVAHLSAAWRDAEMHTSKPLTVILDQVEELFTRPNPDLPDEMDTFLSTLQAIFAQPTLRPQGRLLLSFRKEWLAEIEARLKEQALPRVKVFLERLNHAGIVEAITGPVRIPRLHSHYGLAITDDLPTLIADDLLADAGSPVAPMLQILLTGLWNAAKTQNYDHPCFDQPLYNKLRGQGLGLDDFLTRQLTVLHTQHAPVVESGLALDLLAYHTTPLGTAEQRQLTELTETYRHQGVVLPSLVQRCRDLYLLVDPSANQPDQPPASRLTHDTLAPHVRKRFEESDAPGQRARRILESRVVDWQAGEEGTPLDEADLTVVEVGQAGMRAWRADEERLVAASHVAQAQRAAAQQRLQQEREAAEQRAQIEREKGIAANARAEQEAQNAGKLRQRAWGLAAAATIAVILAVIAYWYYVEANTERSIAETHEAAAVTAKATAEVNEQVAQQAEDEAVAAKAKVERLTRTIRADQLTAKSLNLLNKNPPLALLLAVEGIRAQNDFTTTVVITAPITSQRTFPLTLTTVVSETVISSAQTNVYALLDKVGGLPLAGHASEVLSLAFSPDGRWLATASRDATARLWNVSSPQAEPIVLAGHKSSIVSVAFSPDGRWLATASRDDTARLWDVTDPHPTSIVLVGHEDDVNSVVFSPDGRWLATASDDDTVHLWDVSDPYTDPIVLAGQASGVVSVAFSPDGRWLATGSRDDMARLWNVTDPYTDPIIFAGHEGSIHDVAFSPDGRWLATASSDTSARLWDTTNPIAAPIVLHGHRDFIHDVAFSPDGRWLATASYDSTVRLWNLTATDPSTDPIMLVGHVDDVVSVAFSPDGHWLATASDDNTARVWDMTAVDPGTNPVVLVGHEDDVADVAFSPDGRWLATAAYDKTLRLWDMTAPRADSIVLTSVADVAFSPDGRWLATASDDSTAQLWDVSNADPSRQLDAVPIVLTGHKGFIDSITFSPDGHWLATASSDNTARLWDVTNLHANPVILVGHESAVISVVFSPDGRWLATASDDSTARLWDMIDPRSDPIVLVSHRARVVSVAFSPDGHWLATASDDSTARLWNISTVDPAANSIILAGHQSGVQSVAFSPDGHWLATASQDRTVRLWDVMVADPSANPIIVNGYIDNVVSVTFSPDGRWLATASGNPSGASFDNIVRVWDVSAIHSDPIVLAGHDYGILSLAFSPNGRWLATASGDIFAPSWDSAARLWDLTDPHAEPIILNGHNSIIFSVGFSPDGHWLTTISQDNTARLWTLQVDQLMVMACRVAGRNLTVDEWQRYFQDRKYRKTCPQWPVDPSVTQPLYDGARSLAKQGDIEGAIAEFKQALILDPELGIEPEVEAGRIYASVLEDKGRTLAKAGNTEGAMAEFKQALVFDPSLAIEPEVEAGRIYASVLNDRGHALAQAGDIEGAVAKFEQALTFDPSLGIEPKVEAKHIYAPRIVEDARALAKAGDIDGAVAKFDEALALDPSLGIKSEAEAKRIYAPKVVDAARTLAQTGDIEGAIAKFTEAQLLDPGLGIEPELVAQVEFGRGLSWQDAYTEAMDAFAAVQTISPTFVITTALEADDWNRICWNGSLADAAVAVLPACERAVALAPEDGSIHDSRGLARALTGSIESAIEDFKFYVQWNTVRGKNPERVAQRQEWIAALKAGQNPFDAATLAKLRDSE